jgi:hypothetical protein
VFSGLPYLAEIAFPAVTNWTFSLLDIFNFNTLLRLSSSRRIHNSIPMHFSTLYPSTLAHQIRAKLDSGVTCYSNIFRSIAVSTQFSCRRNHLSGVRRAVFGAGMPDLRLDASRSTSHRGRTNAYTFERCMFHHDGMWLERIFPCCRD